MKRKNNNEVNPLFTKNLEIAKKSSKIVPLLALSSLVILILIPLYNPFSSLLLKSSPIYIPPLTTSTSTTTSLGDDDNNLKQKCDLFTGQWIPNPEAPYYNMTCRMIQDHQNCLKYGRPDTEFIKWRWKPDGCELPIFNPYEFLEIMRGKSLAFVGDSVARNHVQSLFCLLSNVVYPTDVSETRDENFKNWQYKGYDFNVSIFWSPYLVKAQRKDPNDVSKPFNLYLDEYDESWTTQIKNFDYVVISAGHWFFRPTFFYENRNLIGCVYCSRSNITQHTPSFSYRKAFSTTFKAINSLENYEGTIFVRTFTPSHFEGGLWNESGDCLRTRPYRRNEVVLEGDNLKMNNVQVEEFRIWERERIMNRNNGVRLRLMDMTKPMLMRPDGHPSRHGWPIKNMSWPSDCVHWCLPGPIDSWNDLLLEILRAENIKIIKKH